MLFWPWIFELSNPRILLILLPLLLIGLIIWAVIRLSGSSDSRVKEYQRQEKQNEALEILNKRLAAGDISEEDYDRLKSKILQ